METASEPVQDLQPRDLQAKDRQPSGSLRACEVASSVIDLKSTLSKGMSLLAESRDEIESADGLDPTQKVGSLEVRELESGPSVQHPERTDEDSPSTTPQNVTEIAATYGRYGKKWLASNRNRTKQCLNEQIKKWIQGTDKIESKSEILRIADRGESTLKIVYTHLHKRTKDKENGESVWRLFEAVTAARPSKEAGLLIKKFLERVGVKSNLPTSIKELAWAVWENIFEEKEPCIESDVLDIHENLLAQDFPSTDKEITLLTLLFIQMFNSHKIFANEDKLAEKIKENMTKRNLDSRSYHHWINEIYRHLRKHGACTRAEAQGLLFEVAPKLKFNNCVYAVGHKIEEKSKYLKKVPTGIVMMEITEKDILIYDYKRHMAEQIDHSTIESCEADNGNLEIRLRKGNISRKYVFETDGAARVADEVRKIRGFGAGPSESRPSKIQRSPTRGGSRKQQILDRRLSNLLSFGSISRDSRFSGSFNTSFSENEAPCGFLTPCIHLQSRKSYRLYTPIQSIPLTLANAVCGQKSKPLPCRGQIFGKTYYILPESRKFSNKNVFVAKHILNKDVRILKFYENSETFEMAKSIYGSLDCPHICRLLDVIEGEDGYLSCLVFEKGEVTLKDWIEQRRYPIQKRDALYQILKALEYLRSESLVHGDLKPENIMLFPGGIWKLIDLDNMAGEGTQITAPVAYTWRYAAPELLAHVQDESTGLVRSSSLDMYSLGVIAFEIIKEKRFYRDQVTEREIARLGNRSNKELINEPEIETEEGRELVLACVSTKASSRISASDALSNGIFYHSEEGLAAERRKKMREELEQTAEIVQTCYEDNFEITAWLHEYICEKDKHRPFWERQCGELEIQDTVSEGITRYRLALQEDYRLKIQIKRKIGSSLPFDRVAWVKVQPGDEAEVSVAFAQFEISDNTCTGIAQLASTDFSGGRLWTELTPPSDGQSPSFFQLKIRIGLITTGTNLVTLECGVTCGMHHQTRVKETHSRLDLARRDVRWAYDKATKWLQRAPWKSNEQVP